MRKDHKNVDDGQSMSLVFEGRKEMFPVFGNWMKSTVIGFVSCLWRHPHIKYLTGRGWKTPKMDETVQQTHDSYQTPLGPQWRCSFFSGIKLGKKRGDQMKTTSTKLVEN